MNNNSLITGDAEDCSQLSHPLQLDWLNRLHFDSDKCSDTGLMINQGSVKGNDFADTDTFIVINKLLNQI